MQPTKLSGSWQNVYIANRLKLKRTLIAKNRHNRQDRTKQSSSFQLSQEVKTFSPRMIKGNKAINICFDMKIFIRFIQKKIKGYS
jgi:hypothetical protein